MLIAWEDPRKGNFVPKLVLSMFQRIQERMPLSLIMKCFRNLPITKFLNKGNIFMFSL